MEKLCVWLVHGGRQVIGGAKIVGREMNGMSPLKSVQRFQASLASSLQVIYRIYRELRTGLWFVEGIYD